MKSFINKILCTELYLIIVTLSPVKLFLKIPSVKRQLIKSGYIKINGNDIDYSKYYDHLGTYVSSIHFYSRVVLHGCGVLPLWLLICRKTIMNFGAAGIAITSVILSFGIPLIVVENYVLKNDVWGKYWKQILALPVSKRKNLMAITCIIVILFVIIYCAIYMLCIPNMRHISQ